MFRVLDELSKFLCSLKRFVSMSDELMIINMCSNTVVGELTTL